ncbi:tRNA-modifying protein [Eikenella sp. NML03-A-027]|uniref:CAF17-like 4Fe-4S cluster assembly/insertion protein YgfZ n=1 Tax=Eikenella sp. NML03-A-027 TaxID=1795828 RepID=UPI0007E05CB2|nr:folate-binding protein YgfZ [Eikenella sp. NML03-A-027]OAM32275.1 tRNA-modifying protein [Eikenella sp. NML03-A-027]
MHTLCKLPFFGVAEVSGADAAEFLHSQLSNHILDLQPGEVCFATYNSPRGRVLANMLVLRRADRFLLVMAADLLEATIKRLRMFVLRSKTVFHTDSAWQVYGQSSADTGVDAAALKFAAEEDDNGLITLVLAGGNRIVLSPATLPDADCPAAAEAWQAAEILQGRPWISQPTVESCVAQMLNQHLLGGVHFKKGCYPGQEIIARAQYRGQVRRGMAVCRSVQPVAIGSKVEADGEEVGIVINSVAHDGAFVLLAVIKHGAAGKALQAGGQALQTLKLWFETEAAG